MNRYDEQTEELYQYGDNNQQPKFNKGIIIGVIIGVVVIAVLGLLMVNLVLKPGQDTEVSKPSTSIKSDNDTSKKEKEEDPLTSAQPSTSTTQTQDLSGSTSNSGGAQISGFSVQASSTRAPINEFSYGAQNLLDGNTNTAWVEGVAGDGVGESITFTYNGSSKMKLSSVGITNGYVKSTKTFTENGKATKMSMAINGNRRANLTLSVTAQTQYFTVSNITLSPGDQISFKIEGAQRGSLDTDNDTAMTAFYFYQ